MRGIGLAEGYGKRAERDNNLMWLINYWFSNLWHDGSRYRVRQNRGEERFEQKG